MRYIFDLLHAGRETERAQRFFQVVSLRPNIGNQNGVAVAANRVLEEIGQLRLTVGYVVALLVCGANHDLL